jgi:adenylate cyclase
MTNACFVARKEELAGLGQFLDRALAGEGQVCFVAGDAGSGKTALITEFARRAQEKHGALVVAVGQSDAETGIGDPYLPFREVLGQLTGDVEAQVARGAISNENAGRLRKLLNLSLQALVEVGPDLIGVFVPGAGLAMQVGAFAAEKVGWLEKLEHLIQRPRPAADVGSSGIDQDNIFEQYTNVLKRLAAQQPLMLVLDDLHWADAASIALLFRLGRRIGESPILIVGTYRPDEVAMGRPVAGSGQVERHPLEKVLAEFQRYFGEIGLDLSQTGEAEGQRFVNALLDTEPNRLQGGFREALYHHTGGNPLFTIELLRDMQERGDIVRDGQGRWIEQPSLNWSMLPPRVEGVIQERIGRLEDELCEALTVASVEGEDFTAEVVASVQQATARGFIRQLSGALAKRHRLVSARGIHRLESGQRLSLYRFQHNLFQTYLYNSLDEVERAVLHEDVGNVLEELYGNQVDEITVQLAWHFVEADLRDKAVRYLRRAGEQAAAQYANDEAVSYLSRALALALRSDLAERYAALRVRERVYDVQGQREAQREDLAELAELAEALDERQLLAIGSRQAEVALRQAACAEVTGEYQAAIAAAERAIGLAQAAQDTANEAAGSLAWGRVLCRQGDYGAARLQIERAVALARDAGLHQEEADSLRNLGIVSARGGDYAQAGIHFAEALQLYREIDDRKGQSSTVNALGAVHAEQGDFARARRYFEQALAVYREIGDRWGEGAALGNLGQVCADQGRHLDARRYLADALRLCREIEDREGEGAALTNLGVISGELGDHGAAKAHFEQAVALLRKIGDRRVEGFALGGLGLVHLRLGDYGPASEHLQRAIDLLHEIGDPQGEALVLSYRGLLLHRLGDDEAARDTSREALRIATETGDRATQAYALTHLGHALAALGAAEEATDAYRQAVDIRLELDQPNLATEARAGLARLALVAGASVSASGQGLAQARDHVQAILDYLKTGTLDGALEPFRVYLTCVQVLRAMHDPRAKELLAQAHLLLHRQAVQIPDPVLQHTFLASEHATAIHKNQIEIDS